MRKQAKVGERREKSLTRNRIIEASIELLDNSGESGLTFRILSEKLATGPGAIYWHIASKDDLLAAACDTIVARTLGNPAPTAAPEEAIRNIALGIFDAMEAHPWIGSTLTRTPGKSPIVRIIEHIGRQLGALGVPAQEHWVTVSALLNYILGVAGQNAANTLLALTTGADRSEFLNSVAADWSRLDPEDYVFTRAISGQMLLHDDRKDFLAGINIILRGISRPYTDPPAT